MALVGVELETLVSESGAQTRSARDFLCIYMKNISKNLDSNLEKQGQIVKSQKKKENIQYIQRNDKITIHFSLFTRFVLFKQGPAVFYSNGVRYSLLF